MGTYATQAELKARFEDEAAVAHLTDTAESGVPDTAVLDEVIDHAEGQIDSYCAMRFKVPLAVGDHPSLAAMIRSVTLDLAVYHLYSRGHAVTEATVLLHDKAIEWLKEVAAGSVMLPSPDTEASTVAREPRIAFGTSDVTSDDSSRIFSRESQRAL